MKNLKLASLALLAATFFASCTDDNPSLGAIKLECSYTSPLTLTNHNTEGVDYTCDCDVDFRSALTIAPGVTVQFTTESAGFYINTGGSVSALGTSTEPIVLQGTAGVPSWKGLAITTGSPSNRLEHVTIRNAGFGSARTVCDATPAALFIEGTASVVNCTIDGSDGYGIQIDYCIGNSPNITSFTGNTIRNCDNFPILSQAHQLKNLSLAACNFANNAQNYVAFRTDNSNNTITGTHVWGECAIPYLALESLGITSNGSSLTFEAGVDLAFEDNDIGLFIENGTFFRTNGIASKPVKIRGKQAVAGYFSGVFISSTSSNNVLNYTQFSDGGRVSYTNEGLLKGNVTMGAFYGLNGGSLDNGSATFNNCTSTRSNGSCDIVKETNSDNVVLNNSTMSVCVDE
jgi:hypothetical protein